MAKASLLVLDNALDHDFYRPVEHWQRLAGFEPDSVHLPAGGRLPEPGRHSHVIISGSEDSITVRPDWAEQEADWVAKAIERGTRVLGSCWGHQLLTVALVGPQSVRHSAKPEFGWLEIEVVDPDDILPKGSWGTFCSHFDEVVPDCHPDLKILAKTADCQVHAFRFGDLPVWGIQAHPEIDMQTGRQFLSGACELWPEHSQQFESGLAGPVNDSLYGPELVRRFLSF